MGIENLGGAIYDMLKNFKEPLLFDAMIRDFDERYFKYGDEVMTYSPDEQHNPYIDENGNEYFEYSQTENHLSFSKMIMENISIQVIATILKICQMKI